jgi:hypothetical protein
VGGRSTTQKIGVVAVLAVLVTAPFGGLGKAHTDDAATIRLGTRYDIGPFYLTIDKVETLGDLAPSVSPTGRNRLLVIEVDVRNHSYRAESADLVVQAVGGTGTGAVPWPDQKDISVRTFDVADGSEVGTETINPGQSYQLALVVQQAPDWQPGHFALSLAGYEFEHDDPTALDPNEWILTKVLAKGPVDVEVKP